MPLLWRFHQVHHSDPACTVSTALRFHPGELLLSLPVRGAAVLLLGAPSIAVIVFEGVFTSANVFEHGDITLSRSLERILERVCITPGLHRRHHSQERDDMDSNFGTIFVWWDRCFGTHRPSASEETVAIGLPDVGDVSTFRRVLLLPMLRPPQ